ncbi:hypothetical protein SDC9_200173 [bioreactor metagenome]|uniref:Uncharacterized protein n=1 Tax=bioreactor metagenome TaxID=1076179 RepID=A0A645IMH7_9ZZZZ
MGGGGSQTDGLAIGGGLGNGVHADVAAGAGLVFHDHGAQAVAHAFGQGPRGDIQRAAGGEGHDQADGGVLRQGQRGGQGHGGCGGMDQKGSALHGAWSVQCLSASEVNASAKNSSGGRPSVAV